MSRKIVFNMFLAVIMITLTACANASAAPKGPVEVKIAASEFKYDSSLKTFKAGTPYHFVVTNTGKVSHDFLIMPAGGMDEEKAILTVDDRSPARNHSDQGFHLYPAGRL